MKLYPYIHSGTDGGCGKVAFYTTRMPTPGERVTRSIIRDLHGKPMGDDQKVCYSCGLWIRMLKLANFQAEPVEVGAR